MDWTFIFQQSISASVGIYAIYYALAAIGLNMHFGYTGLLNFGQAGFLAVGAYTVAICVVEFRLTIWIAFIAGVMMSILLALILGIPTLRLRADYLAIVTIAAAEIIRQVVRSVTLKDYFGGSSGITSQFGSEFFALNPFKNGLELKFLRFVANDLWVVVVGWIIVGLFVLLTFLIVRSPWGRVIRAIREDEDAVRSLGKNVYLYKMQSLILGGVAGAFAGFVFAISQQSVQPDNYSTALTFFAYAVLILGGAARVLGPVVGSIIFWFLLTFVEQILRQLVQNDFIPRWLMNSNQAGQVRFILVGLALMILMIYRPQGIFGDKKELKLDARA